VKSVASFVTMKNRHLYACLAALFAVAVVYQTRVSIELVQSLLRGTELATFFYGQYDPSARRLVYVNAGHNAPML
jgi:serine phosphatase RsbU (regulator of sigma subunit)